MSHDHHSHDLESEAEAFNQRIEERTSAGFVPDLRNVKRCEFFYKSFWRDPVFTDLYVGEMYRNYKRLISTHIGENKRILDVGCGAGYFSLELARDGHHVTGIDIAKEAISRAKQAHSDNDHKDNFGSLEYYVSSIEEITERSDIPQKYDAVLFSGVLHHLEDINSVLVSAKKLLNTSGIVLGHEPCHESWELQDASMVAMIRVLLSLCGKWYEPTDELLPSLDSESLLKLIDDIKLEYVEERDKSEAGQSPHDNTFNGEQILSCVEEHFTLKEQKPSSSFIYRVLGGVRSDIQNEHDIANFLAMFDKTAVATGMLNSNYFYFCATK